MRYRLGAAQSHPSPIGKAAILFWQPGVKLRWQDFEALAVPLTDGDPDAYLDACCAAQIMVTPKATKQGNGTFLVTSFLVRTCSWVRDSTTAQNRLLLAHKQVHFDINELFARKIRQRVAFCEQSGRYAFGPELAHEIRALLDAKTVFNTRFDTQAHLDRGEGPVRQWEALVRTELDKLLRYQSTADTSDLNAIDWLALSRYYPRVRVP
jgi:hypothetical protein